MANKILVHDGKAHQDDFLAACVCIHKLNAPVFRDKFKEEDLKNTNCWVLDQGRSFDENLHNFDHHQIEQEICAFTMVLDFFYGKEYRKFLPQFRYVEIFDSYGPSAAAKFVEMPVGNIDFVCSPIQTGLTKVFSKINGEVTDPLYSVMKEIGEEICIQIESIKVLFKVLKDGCKFFEYNNIKILDTTKCIMPEGTKHEQLPTKNYCKQFGIEPEIILTVDSRRQSGFRMVSINTDNIKFAQNELSCFTHNSGFLTSFENYEDYKKILNNYTNKKHYNG